MKLPVSTSTARRRSSGTSIQPIRQPVIEKYLRERAEHHAAARRGPGARAQRGLAVLDAVVDLVADQPDPALLAPARDRGQLGRAAASCRSGWPATRRPGRAPGPGTAASCSTVGWNRVSGPQSISTTSTAQCRKHVAVAGVARPGHHHAVAGLERGQEREQEAARGAGGHHHVVGGAPDPGERLVVVRRSRRAAPGCRSPRCSRATSSSSSRLAASRTGRGAPGRRLPGDQVEQVAVAGLARGSPPRAGPSRGTAARWRAARPGAGSCGHASGDHRWSSRRGTSRVETTTSGSRGLDALAGARCSTTEGGGFETLVPRSSTTVRRWLRRLRSNRWFRGGCADPSRRARNLRRPTTPWPRGGRPGDRSTSPRRAGCRRRSPCRPGRCSRRRRRRRTGRRPRSRRRAAPRRRPCVRMPPRVKPAYSALPSVRS